MRKSIWGTLALFANTLAAPILLTQESSVVGRWQGAIAVMGTELDMVVTFTADGGLAATIDIPAQGAAGIALSNVGFDAPHVHFELMAGPGRTAVFDGALARDSIGGTFEQSGVAGTFHLTRADQEEPAAREPEMGPPPYREHEVIFRHDTITLAGTLTVPPSTGPYPAAVLITGSGAQNRDEELFGFRPFRMIADHLTRSGIAVLRYDDRGVGGSSGSVAASTTADFAQDALAGVRFLRNRPDIDPNHVGLIGHSEGGLVAPLAAVQSDEVAFIVLLAGTAVRGDRIIEAQSELIARANGVSEESIARNRTLQRLLARVARGELATDSAVSQLRDAVRSGLDASQRDAIADLDAFVESQVQAQLAQTTSTWFRYFIDYDPFPTLTMVHAPVLAIFGERDLQVPAELNADAMRRALEEGRHSDFTIRILPGANHLFLRAITGSPTEYATLEKVFVPELLPLVAGWINARAQ